MAPPQSLEQICASSSSVNVEVVDAVRRYSRDFICSVQIGVCFMTFEYSFDIIDPLIALSELVFS
jgi:hypothetical protein